jgi:hypothetical protein
MKIPARVAGMAGALLMLVTPAANGEAMLQYFNTNWAELTGKIPELAEAGYSSLWLPPPTKASGGLSVGYDCWDRFDLGSKDQRGTVRTRYGTEAELLELVRVAHRFGIRVYFDNVMNHNAFETPGFNEFVPQEVYPGFMPEDFHLRRTSEGEYRKWDNTRDWNDAWQVQNLGLSDLIDIATEPGSTNFNHGTGEGHTTTKPNYVRHPENPDYYCYIPTGAGQKHSAGQGAYVGFGTGNGITEALITANASFYSERVEDMLHRAARWQVDRTKADGFRLDAVKHTPADFFGATYGGDKDSSNYGYSGQIQQQFNLTRGFSDWSNHRDTVFDTEQGRDDAMLFGEHLGQPPAYGSYIDAGMRLIDNDLRSNFNNLLGNPSAGLSGYDQSGQGGFSASVAVMHAQSHDSDYAARRELQHAFYFTRAGLGLVYTDGNYHAGVLGGSGGAFPRHSNTAFLGQWGDARIPNLLKIHNDFARGWQRGRFSDADLVSYERIDDREFSESNQALKERKGATMLIAVNDNYASGKAILGGTSFPSQGGGGSENNPDTNDEYLFQYARGYGSQVGFYSYASSLGSVVVGPGSYFVFAPRTPEESDLWKGAGGSPITIYQGTEKAGTFEVERKDGTDGDPAFNPYGLPDPVNNDYAYRMSVPRVTSASNLRFTVRADGSAENILLKLDGGVDLNGTRPVGNTDPLYRDRPPAVSTDVFLGYEQPAFVRRQFAEKFAAKDTARNQTGSPGAETYHKVIGMAGFTIVNGPDDANDFGTQGGEVASFLYHDPAAEAGGTPAGGWPGGVVPKQYAEEAATITVWAKPNGVGNGFNMFFYYTSDGTNPEGAGGSGTGTTKVVEMHYSHNQGTDDWWSSATIPKPAAGQTLKYKIGIFKDGAASVYPSGPDTVAKKKEMMTVFEVDGFNAADVMHAPHNDYGATETGLAEGFHVLRARPFLKRSGKASLYNTFTQTFYYDAATPTGQIMFPAADGATIGGNEYGLVVRADNFTSEVWYKIDDGDASNDDSATGTNNGNGAWVEASEVTPNGGITPADPTHGREFRFNYVNIPSTGGATILVRLKEVTSSADNGLSDEAGHFTTLTRTVLTAGPDRKMFVAFPQNDGVAIGSNYVLKTYFSKALADGLSEAQLKARFTVRYGADDIWPTGAQILDPAALSIHYNETADYHALAFSLPNLYDGRPGFLYRVEIAQDRPEPLVDLSATRRLAALSGTGPRLTVLQPQEFDTSGRPVEIILPDGPGADSLAYTVRLETDTTATATDLDFVIGSGTLTPVDFDPVAPGIQPEIQGSSAFWDFTWDITEGGSYRLLATAIYPEAVRTETRNATVIHRQWVADDPNDFDDDDDGLADVDEGTITPLPDGFPTDDPRYKADPDQWTNGEVLNHEAYGRSHPRMPDSDGDGLPDGLEVGLRAGGTGTNVAADTNGDGNPNFAVDLDPPFYDTLDNAGAVPGAGAGDRSARLAGTTTDPGNPDSDGDGLLDGEEDANANGWIDGDGAPLAAGSSPTLGRAWPNGIYDPGEVWSETSPNNPDTDGDGLPDGWEVQHGLNPLDNGSLAMSGGVADMANGAAGDLDGDGIDNLTEWLMGMNPQVADASAFPKLGITKIAGGFRLSFPTLPDRVYQLQVSVGLNGWTNSGTAVNTSEATGPGTLQIDDTSGLPKRFYRMLVQAVP